MGSARARRQRRVAAFLEPLDQLVNPPAGDAMIAGQLSWAAPFKDKGVDDIATECGHAPPPSLVARTMSCDIRELCGELRHLAGRQFSYCSHAPLPNPLPDGERGYSPRRFRSRR